MQHISSCEVCQSTELIDVLDLGDHPLCDDLIPIGSSAACRTYPIKIAYCPTCGTAHQRVQVPKQLLFPPQYHYRARFTADVLNGMSELVAAVDDALGGNVTGKLVLDVGCNDGSLLSKFKTKGCRVLGVEPTGAAADASALGIDVINEYFTEQVCEQIVTQYGKPDVITFTNVFAHIEDLAALLRALGALWKPTTLLVIENHSLDAVLQKNQFDTFYHEHPRTYSVHSFKWIAQSLNARVISASLPKRYGGNIRVMIGRGDLSAGEPDLKAMSPDDHVKAFTDMTRFIETWRPRKLDQINKAVDTHGPLPAKAFPGRAAILVKMLGLNETQITATHERVGSMKLGHWIPGTRIPILSDAVLMAYSPKPLVVLNLAWHISAEIRDYLKQSGLESEVIDILDSLT